MDSWLMILTAWTVAIPASLLGVLLVVRKMVMVGDAISHAVLPGIAVAYFITESRDSFPMLVGAGLMGVLTTFLIDFLNKRLRFQQDAAIGTSFTFLFALGVILIALFAGKNTDLDQECVLYGDLETSVLNQVIYGDYLVGTKAILQQIPICIATFVVLVIGFRGWQIWAFNPDFGKGKGMRISWWQVCLMTLVSLHAVLSFESVGVIMVVGLLVLPPACALQLTTNWKKTFVYSACIGIVVCVLGVLLGIQLNSSIAPTIIAVNGLLFLVIVFLKQVAEKMTTRLKEQN